MRALVVYESMFGNTREVALAVTEGLRDRVPVDLVEVGAAEQRLPDDVGLLVVGAPTHALGLSRPQSRSQAAEKTDMPLVSPGTGLREWLDGIGHRADQPAAAAFDTRVKLPIPGSASRSAARRLRHHGYQLVGRPVSFTVAGTTGPLLDGELARAREWGRWLGEATARASAEPAPEPAPEPGREPGPARPERATPA